MNWQKYIVWGILALLTLLTLWGLGGDFVSWLSSKDTTGPVKFEDIRYWNWIDYCGLKPWFLSGAKWLCFTLQIIAVAMGFGQIMAARSTTNAATPAAAGKKKLLMNLTIAIGYFGSMILLMLSMVGAVNLLRIGYDAGLGWYTLISLIFGVLLMLVALGAKSFTDGKPFFVYAFVAIMGVASVIFPLWAYTHPLQINAADYWIGVMSNSCSFDAMTRKVDAETCHEGPKAIFRTDGYGSGGQDENPLAWIKFDNEDGLHEMMRECAMTDENYEVSESCWCWIEANYEAQYGAELMVTDSNNNVADMVCDVEDPLTPPGDVPKLKDVWSGATSGMSNSMMPNRMESGTMFLEKGDGHDYGRSRKYDIGHLAPGEDFWLMVCDGTAKGEIGWGTQSIGTFNLNTLTPARPEVNSRWNDPVAPGESITVRVDRKVTIAYCNTDVCSSVVEVKELCPVGSRARNGAGQHRIGQGENPGGAIVPANGRIE